MRSPLFAEQLETYAYQTDMAPYLSLGDLQRFWIDLPALGVQRRIAGVLGNLDDLIDLDLSLISSIREIGRALFELWIDQDAPLLVLSDVAILNPETVEERRGALTYLDIASVGDGHLAWPQPILWHEAPSRARRIVREWDTIWSTVRPNRRSHALVISPPESVVASTGFAVLRARVGLSTIGPASLFAATDRAAFADYLAVNSSGSAYPAAGIDVFARAALPSLGERSQPYEDLMRPLWELAGQLVNEIAELRNTRDELLPLLMSGRVVPGEAV